MRPMPEHDVGPGIHQRPAQVPVGAQGGAVPEPTTFALLALIAPLFVRRIPRRMEI